MYTAWPVLIAAPESKMTSEIVRRLSMFWECLASVTDGR
jgi:hypothetical protein